MAALAATVMTSGLRASTIFDFTGALGDGSSVTGTATIDTDLGSISSLSFTLAADPGDAFSTLFGQGSASDAGPYVVFALTEANPGSLPALELLINTVDLVGYTGGLVLPFFVDVNNVSSAPGVGMFTAELNGTPEPGTAAGLMGGMCAIAFLLRKKPSVSRA
jgi:hypothetical protein